MKSIFKLAITIFLGLSFSAYSQKVEANLELKNISFLKPKPANFANDSLKINIQIIDIDIQKILVGRICCFIGPNLTFEERENIRKNSLWKDKNLTRIEEILYYVY